MINYREKAELFRNCFRIRLIWLFLFVPVSTSTIFAQSIPSHTGSASKYHILSSSSGFAVAEFLRLSASFIAGTDTSDGRHGFSLKLPDDYATHSKNPKKGSDPFTNGREIYLASGSLQLIPPSFDSDYEAKVYENAQPGTMVLKVCTFFS